MRKEKVCGFVVPISAPYRCARVLTVRGDWVTSAPSTYGSGISLLVHESRMSGAAPGSFGKYQRGGEPRSDSFRLTTGSETLPVKRSPIIAVAVGLHCAVSLRSLCELPGSSLFVLALVRVLRREPNCHGFRLINEPALRRWCIVCVSSLFTFFNSLVSRVQKSVELLSFLCSPLMTGLELLWRHSQSIGCVSVSLW